jgi:hypothetical protein
MAFVLDQNSARRNFWLPKFNPTISVPGNAYYVWPVPRVGWSGDKIFHSADVRLFVVRLVAANCSLFQEHLHPADEWQQPAGKNLLFAIPDISCLSFGLKCDPCYRSYPLVMCYICISKNGFTELVDYIMACQCMITHVL